MVHNCNSFVVSLALKSDKGGLDHTSGPNPFPILTMCTLTDYNDLSAASRDPLENKGRPLARPEGQPTRLGQ